MTHAGVSRSRANSQQKRKYPGKDSGDPIFYNTSSSNSYIGLYRIAPGHVESMKSPYK